MDILFVVGVVLLFYAALAFDGVSPGGAPVAVIVTFIALLLLLRVIRTLLRDGDILPLVIVFGVLSYLGYAAGQAYFGW